MGVALNMLAMFLGECIVGNIGRKTVLSAKKLPPPQYLLSNRNLINIVEQKNSTKSALHKRESSKNMQILPS